MRYRLLVQSCFVCLVTWLKGLSSQYNSYNQYFYGFIHKHTTTTHAPYVYFRRHTIPYEDLYESTYTDHYVFHTPSPRKKSYYPQPHSSSSHQSHGSGRGAQEIHITLPHLYGSTDGYGRSNSGQAYPVNALVLGNQEGASSASAPYYNPYTGHLTSTYWSPYTGLNAGPHGSISQLYAGANEIYAGGKALKPYPLSKPAAQADAQVGHSRKKNMIESRHSIFVDNHDHKLSSQGSKALLPTHSSAPYLSKPVLTFGSGDTHGNFYSLYDDGVYTKLRSGMEWPQQILMPDQHAVAPLLPDGLPKFPFSSPLPAASRSFFPELYQKPYQASGRTSNYGSRSFSSYDHPLPLEANVLSNNKRDGYEFPNNNYQPTYQKFRGFPEIDFGYRNQDTHFPNEATSYQHAYTGNTGRQYEQSEWGYPDLGNQWNNDSPSFVPKIANVKVLCDEDNQLMLVTLQFVESFKGSVFMHNHEGVPGCSADSESMSAASFQFKIFQCGTRPVPSLAGTNPRSFLPNKKIYQNSMIVQPDASYGNPWHTRKEYTVACTMQDKKMQHKDSYSARKSSPLYSDVNNIEYDPYKYRQSKFPHPYALQQQQSKVQMSATALSNRGPVALRPSHVQRNYKLHRTTASVSSEKTWQPVTPRVEEWGYYVVTPGATASVSMQPLIPRLPDPDPIPSPPTSNHKHQQTVKVSTKQAPVNVKEFRGFNEHDSVKKQHTSYKKVSTKQAPIKLKQYRGFRGRGSVTQITDPHIKRSRTSNWNFGSRVNEVNSRKQRSRPPLVSLAPEPPEALRSNDLPELEADCESAERQMSVVLRFKQYFRGLVYVYQFYDSARCKTSLFDVKAVQFTIPLDGCGTQYEESEYYLDGSAEYSNIIIIMPFDKVGEFLTTKAKAFRIICRSRKRNELLSLPFATPHHKDTSGKPRVLMKIVKGTDYTAAESRRMMVGDTATIAMVYKATEFWDVAITNCVAHDGDGPTSRGRVSLVDDKGCPAHSKYVSNVRKVPTPSSPNEVAIYVQFVAFKFPDKSTVYYECTVNICPIKCYLTDCPKKPNFRGKRDISSEEEGPPRGSRQHLSAQPDLPTIDISSGESIIVGTTFTGHPVNHQQVPRHRDRGNFSQPSGTVHVVDGIPHKPISETAFVGLPVYQLIPSDPSKHRPFNTTFKRQLANETVSVSNNVAGLEILATPKSPLLNDVSSTRPTSPSSDTTVSSRFSIRPDSFKQANSKGRQLATSSKNSGVVQMSVAHSTRPADFFLTTTLSSLATHSYSTNMQAVTSPKRNRTRLINNDSLLDSNHFTFFTSARPSFSTLQTYKKASNISSSALSNRKRQQVKQTKTDFLPVTPKMAATPSTFRPPYIYLDVPFHTTARPFTRKASPIDQSIHKGDDDEKFTTATNFWHQRQLSDMPTTTSSWFPSVIRKDQLSNPTNQKVRLVTAPEAIYEFKVSSVDETQNANQYLRVLMPPKIPEASVPPPVDPEEAKKRMEILTTEPPVTSAANTVDLFRPFRAFPSYNFGIHGFVFTPRPLFELTNLFSDLADANNNTKMRRSNTVDENISKENVSTVPYFERLEQTNVVEQYTLYKGITIMLPGEEMFYDDQPRPAADKLCMKKHVFQYGIAGIAAAILLVFICCCVTVRKVSMNAARMQSNESEPPSSRGRRMRFPRYPRISSFYSDITRWRGGSHSSASDARDHHNRRLR